MFHLTTPTPYGVGFPVAVSVRSRMTKSHFLTIIVTKVTVTPLYINI